MKLFKEVKKSMELGYSLVNEDIEDVVLLSKQILIKPEEFAVCLPCEFILTPGEDETFFPMEPFRLSRDQLFSAHSVWVPYSKHSETTILGIVITPMIRDEFINIYMEEHVENTTVMLTYVLPCGSFIKFGDVYNWKHLSDMQVDNFFEYVLSDFTRRKLFGILGNAWDMIEKRVHPTQLTERGIVAKYPFEVSPTHTPIFK